MKLSKHHETSEAFLKVLRSLLYIVFKSYKQINIGTVQIWAHIGLRRGMDNRVLHMGIHRKDKNVVIISWFKGDKTLLFLNPKGQNIIIS